MSAKLLYLALVKYIMRKFRFLLINFIAVVLSLVMFIPVLAEGSRELYPNGGPGARANIEWRTNTYGPSNLIARRTLFYAYMNAGETLSLGSSAVGVNNANILVYAPGAITGPIGGETIGASTYDCQAERVAAGLPNTLGQITSRAQELAGPLPNGGGYNPCTYTAPANGLYGIIYYGPTGDGDGSDGNPTTQVNLAGGGNFDATQGTGVAAWDATVRTAGVDQPGRVFSYSLAMHTGGNGLPVHSTFYPVTLDGYIYQTDTNGYDPNGYMVYGNRSGFFDSDGVTPLYHDVVSAINAFSLPALVGGAGMERPQFPIFFNQPDPQTLTALGIPLAPIAPTVTGVSFTGSITGNTSLVSAGGTFNFTANVAGRYELIVSRDGIDFDPTNLMNRVLRGDNSAGVNTVAWDGLDNSGAPFPVGSYSVRVSIRAGEYHFPLIDAENSTNGGPSYTLTNPPAGCQPFNGGCSAGFYDDRGYQLMNGNTVGTVNVALCGNNPPAVAVSDLINGFDTTTNQRGFGAGGGGNTNESCLNPGANVGAFGDVKGLDMWTFYPSNAEIAPLIIVDTIPPQPPVNPPPSSGSGNAPTITKTVTPPFAQPGETVTWTIVIGNPSGSPINNLVMTDNMPAELTLLTAVGSIGTASINGQQVQYTIPSLAPGQSATLTVTSRVRADAVVPFVLENQACVVSDSNATPLCDTANVLSVAQLPATGQSPYTESQQLWWMLMGLVAVLGTRQVIRKRTA